MHLHVLACSPAGTLARSAAVGGPSGQPRTTWEALQPPSWQAAQRTSSAGGERSFLSGSSRVSQETTFETDLRSAQTLQWAECWRSQPGFLKAVKSHLPEPLPECLKGPVGTFGVTHATATSEMCIQDASDTWPQLPIIMLWLVLMLIVQALILCWSLHAPAESPGLRSPITGVGVFVC